jgi:hypothetical protein
MFWTIFVGVVIVFETNVSCTINEDLIPIQRLLYSEKETYDFGRRGPRGHFFDDAL